MDKTQYLLPIAVIGFLVGLVVAFAPRPLVALVEPLYGRRTTLLFRVTGILLMFAMIWFYVRA